VNVVVCVFEMNGLRRHSLGIVHRDLKPENGIVAATDINAIEIIHIVVYIVVLLDGSGHVRLTDVTLD
jgi:serine/threonine protein kinase